MPIPAAAAIIFDDTGRLLLVRRGKPPHQGHWSVPGGKCEPGETVEAACVREVVEETGLVVEIVRLAGRVVRPAPTGTNYVIADFVCRIVDGSLTAGDDAAAAGWFRLTDLVNLPMVDGLVDTLAAWGLLPD